MDPVPGEYLVILKTISVAPAEVAAVAAEHAAQHNGRILATFSNGLLGYGIKTSPLAAQILTSDPRVLFVEENSYGHLSSGTDYYPDDRKWHLNRIDNRSPIASNPTKAYGWTSTGWNVDVYVMDTGVQSGHGEFGNIWVDTGANYAGEDGFPSTNPCGGWVSKYNGGHGTAVASLVAGSTVGVAREATIIPVKIATCNPGVPSFQNPEIRITTIGAVWGLDWILAAVRGRGRRAVVNLSFYFDQNPQSFCDADTTSAYDCRGAFESNLMNLLLEDKGVVVVASANNQGQNRCAEQTPARMGYGGMYDPLYDANPSNDHLGSTWRGVITVGGTNISDQRYVCPTCDPRDRGSNHGPCVSIYAPAHRIQAAHIASPSAYRDEQVWLTQAINSSFYPAGTTLEMVYSGTSFSAPIVSGIAARLLQSFPSHDVREIWNHIYSNSNALPTDFDGDGVSRNDRLVYISVSQ